MRNKFNYFKTFLFLMTFITLYETENVQILYLKHSHFIESYEAAFLSVSDINMSGYHLFCYRVLILAFYLYYFCYKRFRFCLRKIWCIL